MGKSRLLVDTDILIHYLNHRRYRNYLESEQWQVYYSVITKKELLAKQGLSGRERRAILFLLGRYRQIAITQAVAGRYAELRRRILPWNVKMRSLQPQLWSAGCRCSLETSGIFASSQGSYFLPCNLSIGLSRKDSVIHKRYKRERRRQYGRHYASNPLWHPNPTTTYFLAGHAFPVARGG